MKITERQLRRIIKETLSMASLVSKSFPISNSSSDYSGTSSGGIVLGTVDPRLGTSDQVEADEMEEDEEVIDEDEDETEENE